jgi:hypothetical protein
MHIFKAKPPSVGKVHIFKAEPPSGASCSRREPEHGGVDADVVNADVVYADEYTRHGGSGSTRQRILVDAADM